MATLPTCSVRALPEHHQLLRRIGRALATQPDLIEPLTTLIGDVTHDVTHDVTRADTAVDERFKDVERRHEDLHILLQTLQEHLARQEKSTLALNAMAENINDRVKALERRGDPQAVTQQHGSVTQPPRKRRSRPKTA
jgi:hypothetical protein